MDTRKVYYIHIQSENDLWIMAHSIFINILNTGLPVVRQFSDSSDFDHLWAPLEAAYKDFLFNVSDIFFVDKIFLTFVLLTKFF